MARRQVGRTAILRALRMGATERVWVGAAGRLLTAQRVEYLSVVQVHDEVSAVANIQRGIRDS